MERIRSFRFDGEQPFPVGEKVFAHWKVVDHSGIVVDIASSSYMAMSEADRRDHLPESRQNKETHRVGLLLRDEQYVIKDSLGKVRIKTHGVNDKWEHEEDEGGLR